MNAKPERRREALQLLKAAPWLSDREVARRVGLGNKTVSRLRGETGIARRVATAGLRAQELAAAAGVSERQLRRWRAHGLLPQPTCCSVGKRGISVYPPRSAELTRAISELMTTYHDVDRVALGLLALGWSPSEETLRHAYLRFVERQEQ